MSDEQKYLELLKCLAELLKSKNDEIIIKDYEINVSKQLIEIAERKIKKLKNEPL